ncbi:MAG: PAS domain S-box protein [Gemmataceae bacterium]|nr:PAS domain S-box protein [Gemmataceae bacterium]MDW8266635.1 PAS domain S-box protein [Gemmataceae bacterium]
MMRASASAGHQTAARDSLTTSRASVQALLEAAVDGIISIDERGIIQTINPAAERLFGYNAEELVGRNVGILMPPPYCDEHDQYLARYLATGQKRIIGIGREVVGRRKDGSTFPMELSVAEARWGNRRAFVGIIRDITERKRAEEALRQTNASLESAVAELKAKNAEIRAMTQQLWQAAKLASVGELAASIAHELNNPLATISLRIESVLSRTPADDPRRRALEIIDQEVRRMSRLVANLLDFSRRGEEQISTVDTRRELAEAVELVAHHLRKRQIQVVQELTPGTPDIFADRQKLRQVFLNLLTNASDAMPQGGTLTLRTAPTTMDDGRPAVLIEFSDTGIGIPAANLPRIMEPFFTTKEEGKGTGLGLAICRRVIQEHQGTITITSTEGVGTTVTLRLPVRSDANVAPIRNSVVAPDSTKAP